MMRSLKFLAICYYLCAAQESAEEDESPWGLEAVVPCKIIVLTRIYPETDHWHVAGYV